MLEFIGIRITSKMKDSGLENLISEIEYELKDDFEKTIFKGSIRVLCDSNNPIRLHLFSAGIRELINYKLELLAPSENVKICSWYIQKNIKNPDNSHKVIYALQGGLNDDFICNTLGLETDVHDTIYGLIGQLNKYIHINREEGIISKDSNIERNSLETLNTFKKLFSEIKSYRRSLSLALENKIPKEIIGEIVLQGLYAAERIATHSFVGTPPDIVDIQVIRITHEIVEFRVDGSVSADLQWGSDEVIRKAIGAIIPHDFPFSCSLISTVDKPLYPKLNDCVNIDDSSWYEDIVFFISNHMNVLQV